MRKWVCMLVMSASIIGGVLSIEAEEGLPDYYQPVIEDYVVHYDSIINKQGVQDTEFIDAIAINNIYKPTTLKYSLYDIDNNDIPELFLANMDTEHPYLFMIFTYDGQNIIRLADYNPSGYLTNKSYLDFLRNGQVVYTVSSGAFSYHRALMEMADNGTEFNEIAAVNVWDQEYTKPGTEEPASQEAIEQIQAVDSMEKIDIYSEFTWHNVTDQAVNVEDKDLNAKSKSETDPSSDGQDASNGSELSGKQMNSEGIEGKNKESKSNSADDLYPAEPADDLPSYLATLRQINQKYLDDYRANLVNDLPSDRALLSEDEIKQLIKSDFHPILAKISEAYLDQLHAYESGMEFESHSVREMNSHLIVAEKMLLPELSKNELNAFHLLKLATISLYSQMIQAEANEPPVMARGFILDYLRDQVNNLEEVVNLSDLQYDQINRVAILTGNAPETKGILVNELQTYQDVSYLPHPAEEYNHYMMTISPGAQDVGGNTFYHFHSPTGEVLESNLGQPIDFLPVETLNLAELYQVELINHYPVFDKSDSNVTDQTSETTQSKGTSSEIDNVSSSATAPKALVKLVSSWGAEMGQLYQEYTPERPVKFYGGELPQAQFEIMLDGKVQAVTYSPDQDVQGSLQLIGVFSDISDIQNPLPERHVYLFVLDHGQPRALIATQGPNDKGLYQFKDTANQALSSGFINLKW